MTIARAVLTGILLAGAAEGAGAQAPALSIRVVRFYQPEFQQTVVKAFVQFPVSGLTVPAAGPQAQMTYRMAVKVTDSTGLTLLPEQPWRGHVDASLKDVPGATALEMFDFPVKAGKYQMTVTVDDSAGGLRLTRSVPVEGFPPGVGGSDLVLSPMMRVADADDSVPRVGEWRRGSTVIRAAADVALDPIHEDRASLYYLLEAYTSRTAGPDSGSLTVKVADTSGHVVVRTPPRMVQLGAGGGILRGQVPLLGLPEGSYTLTADVTVAGKVLERSAPFRMGDLKTALEQEERTRQATLVSDSGYFGAMGDDSLDEAFAPLEYVAGPEDQLAVWKRGLSTSAKRQFLINFWGRRDPTPGTPKNEAREQFYGFIALANQKFTERGQGARPGWRSDRGRIFIKNGQPAERLQRQNIGTAPPYEVWRYSTGRDRWYVFVDVSGFGAFQLVASNDLHEASRPSWQTMLGSDAVKDIGQYLNLDLQQDAQSQ